MADEDVDFAQREKDFNASLGGNLAGVATAAIEADGCAKDADLERTVALLNRKSVQLDASASLIGLDEALTTKINVPPVVLIDPNGLGIKSVVAKWSMTTSARQSSRTKVEAGASASVKASYFGIGASFNAHSSVESEKKRDSDYTATTTCDMTMERSAPAEGLSKIVDALVATVESTIELNKGILETKAQKIASSVESGDVKQDTNTQDQPPAQS